MEITMKDIAQALGTSVATVSRALSDSPNISQARKDEIRTFAAEHNFTPNVIAKNLRHTKQQPVKVIGVIIPELVNYFFATVLDGIEAEASQRGYHIIMRQSKEEYEREVQICKEFYEMRVCGIIVSQAKNTHAYNHFIELKKKGIPLVFYDRICHGINASRVVVDDYQGVFRAVEYLISTGCKRIAFYGTDMSLEIAKNRFNGYKDALLKYGIAFDESLIRLCDNREKAELTTQEMLSREDRPDAFFAINDDTALGILFTAKHMGFNIPEDISICGFGNGQRTLATEPLMTTIDQHGFEVGRKAVDTLLSVVEGEVSADRPQRHVVRTKFMQRGTTR